jgi:hypothetical protein
MFNQGGTVRNVVFGSILCALVLMPAPAAALEGEVSVSGGNLVETATYRAGVNRIEIQAERGVDINALMVAAKVRPADDPDVVVSKINAARQRLYPKQEIALSTSIPKDSVTTTGIVLFRRYIYWNRSSSATVYWTSTGAAVAFVSDVTGAWNYYECNGCSKFVYRSTVRTGGALTNSLQGGYYTRGFSLVRATSFARADIILYFFY